MDGKKISFGFSKITKKPALQLNKTTPKDEGTKIELIKCLEGQEIKLIEEKKESAPLVIPLKDGGKTSAALASLAKRRAVLLGEDDVTLDKKDADNGEQSTTEIGELTLEKRAEKEILAELKTSTEEGNQSSLVLPVVKADDLPLEGAKESSLDDYESIPIEQYGWAMLRGMGAVEPLDNGKKGPVDNGPVQRPPGLGLGADKALKPKPLLEQPEANEKLEIKKKAFVRILAGKFKDGYGQIEGFDHERGTIVVKLAIGNTKQKFQEFLCQPVSKKEYAQFGKCINKAKYEEYKKMENEHGQVVLKKESDVKLKTEKCDIKREQSNHHRSISRSRSTSISKKFSTKLRSRSRSLTPTKKYQPKARSRSRSPARSKPFNSRARSRSLTPKSNKYSSKYRVRSKSRSMSPSPVRSSSKSRYIHDRNYERNDSFKNESKSSDNKSKKKKKKHKHKHSSSSQSESDNSDNAYHSRHHKREKKKKSKKKSKKDSRR